MNRLLRRLRAGFDLRRQFQLLIGVGVLLAAGALVVLGTAVRETRRLEAAHLAAVEMAREMTGLLVLTQEYLLYGEPRARDQWQARPASPAWPGPSSCNCCPPCSASCSARRWRAATRRCPPAAVNWPSTACWPMARRWRRTPMTAKAR